MYENLFFHANYISIFFFILRHSIPEMQEFILFFFINYKIEIYFFLKISVMLYRVKIVMICDE